MANSTRTKPLACWLVAAIGILSLIVYFALIGLDKADKSASVIGALIGIISLAATMATLLQRRDGEPAEPGITQHQQSGANSVNIQAGNDLSIGNNNKLNGR